MRTTLPCALACLLAACGTAALADDNLRGLTYFPLEPCRVLDTRTNSGQPGANTGPLQVGVPVSLLFTNPPVDCGAPYGPAKALVLNVLAVNAEGPGHLRIWPFSDPLPPPPNASIINYATGFNFANGVVLTLCNEPDGDNEDQCDADLVVQAFVNRTHLVVDLLGYFADPGTGPLWGQGRPGAFAYWANCTTSVGIERGLSRAVTTWDGSPAACPAGTWVCSESDAPQVACDTPRPENACEARDCAGDCLDFPANDHQGWLANAEGQADPTARSEQGTNYGTRGCEQLPVWCCRYRHDPL